MRPVPVLLALAAAGFAWAAAPPPRAGRAVVAADHPLASEAGAEVLRAGGNAIDAAVAAALAAGVVQPAGSGLGGGGFATWTDGSTPHFLDFREVAPASSHRDQFRRSDGTLDADAAQRGGRAVAVPSESRGLAQLQSCCGRLPFARVAAPAIRLAAGFPVGPHLAGALAKQPPDGVRALFDVGGRVAREGDRVARPALARALAAWARSGGEDLATGAGARAIVDAVQGAGGSLTLADLAAHHPRERAPLVGSYRGWTLWTAPPPSSGGVILLEMLGVLEALTPPPAQPVPVSALLGAEHLHRVAETMKHAYADRARYLGDPDHVDVPVERLLSADRRDEILRAITPARTYPPERYGSLVDPPTDAGTHHLSVIDGEGRAVALTTTINTAFGSGVVPPSLGFPLNNQMDDFALAPGVPNAFGLVGAEANAIAPGKRPLSSMSPTVMRSPDGATWIAIGASGGAFIPSAVLSVVVAIVDGGLDPAEAVSLPRIHHQWLPNTLFVEPGFGDETIRALEGRGHDIVLRDGFSAVQVVVLRDGRAAAASDPRKDGVPASVW